MKFKEKARKPMRTFLVFASTHEDFWGEDEAKIVLVQPDAKSAKHAAEQAHKQFGISEDYCHLAVVDAKHARWFHPVETTASSTEDGPG